MNAQVRKFDSGATRDLDRDKLDFEGFLCPLVVERFGQYMHSNRVLADGTLRDSANWQLGIPVSAYVKSMWRHFHAVWKWHRGYSKSDVETDLCAVIFNAQGMLHELIKQRQTAAIPIEPDVPHGSADALVEALLPAHSKPGED